jgi:MFS family permease
MRSYRPPSPAGKKHRLTATPLSYRQLLRISDVPELLLATCLARLATRMFMLAIVLYVLGRFHAPALAGWVSFAAVAPGLMISPVAGALLDRIGAAKAIVADMALSALLVCIIAIVGWMGALGAPLLLALVTVYSLTSPLSAAGIRTLLPRLVPAAALDRANALDASSYAIIDVLGPALAGALSGFAGAGPTLLVIATLYALAGLSLLRLARRTPLRPAALSHPLLSEAVAGLGYVMRHPSLRGLAIAYSLYQVSWGVLLVAIPVYVMRELGSGAIGDSVVGALWAASGMAGALGAIWAGHATTLGRERRFIALGTLATAVAIYPLSATFGLLGLAVGLFLVGFLAGPVDVAVLALRQRRTEPGWLGRVLAVSMSLNLSGLPLGSALGGWLVTHSLTASFAAAALASVLAALAAAVLVPMRSERQVG